MAKQFTGLRRELTIILLEGRSVKLIPNDFLYTVRSMHSSSSPEELSLSEDDV